MKRHKINAVSQKCQVITKLRTVTSRFTLIPHNSKKNKFVELKMEITNTHKIISKLDLDPC